jgi:hypothetical protein
MYEDIKGIIGKTLGFIFWLIVLSFCIGYTWGNYNGMKTTIDNPRVFEFNVFPGYFILSVEKHPEIKKYK